MVLSRLQRYILTQALAAPKRTLSRASIARFYDGSAHRPKGKDLVNIISRSIDRLVSREFLVGYGRKTATKWFVETVKLTPKGRRASRKMLGEQQRLPLKI
ncbi:MAG: hypothetical protein PHI63_04245 [Patescibacteria group bacterium]|nr:hypothetical protein [Patescibacteria group bacterium]